MGLVEAVSGSGLVAVYSVLLSAARDTVEDRCEDIGIDLERLEWALLQYREYPQEYDAAHLQMARWLVVQAGPRTGATPAQFEAAVVAELQALGASDKLVFPCWLLAAPVDGALQGRLPARPLGGFDEILERAHDGLLGHVGQRGKLTALPHREIAVSSTIWRIAGLVEDIAADQAPGEDLHHQIAWLQSRLTKLPVLSTTEQTLCKILDPDVSNWRNALTHVSRNKPWTFVAAADDAETRERDIWDMAAAINLGVLDHLAEQVRTMPPPRGIFSAVESSFWWV